MHERGMADDELIDEHERDRFADVATSRRPRPTATRDGHTVDDRARDGATRPRDGEPEPPSTSRAARTSGASSASRITDDVRESERR